MGYFGLAYYLENQDKLRAVKVNNVMPSAETVNNGAYTPLARPLYMYVKKSSLSSNPQVRAFVEFSLENATELVTEVGYVPLPESRYTSALQRL